MTSKIPVTSVAYFLQGRKYPEYKESIKDINEFFMREIKGLDSNNPEYKKQMEHLQKKWKEEILRPITDEE